MGSASAEGMVSGEIRQIYITPPPPPPSPPPPTIRPRPANEKILMKKQRRGGITEGLQSRTTPFSFNVPMPLDEMLKPKVYPHILKPKEKKIRAKAPDKADEFKIPDDCRILQTFTFNGMIYGPGEPIPGDLSKEKFDELTRKGKIAKPDGN